MKLKQIAALLAFQPLFAAQPGAGAAPAETSGGNAKAPKFCEKDWDDAFESVEKTTLYLRFRDGTVLEFDIAQVEDELTRHRLMMHGASQKIGDSFAGVKGNFAEGKANAQGVIDLLYRGEWSEEREGGGPRLGELSEAISRIKGVELEKVRKVVEDATPEERASWRSNNEVKKMVAQIRLEKAQQALEAEGEKKQELQINLG